MSAQDTTYGWLRQRIATLPRHEGTFLSEVALAAEAGVSRTPVREALLRLEAEGWLRIVPRKGAFIAPISDAEVDAVMEARLLVEESSVRRAAELRAPVVERLEELLDEQRDRQDDPTTFIDLDREFHRTIINAAGNPVLASFYETLRDRQLRMGVHAVVTGVNRTEQVLAEHRAIVDALRERDPERAVAALHEHLGTTLSVLRSAPALSPLRTMAGGW
jgi:DNA-binding GntR family transcriptional regulator